MEIDQLIQKRRAYRSLDPVEIDDEMIVALSESIRLSPSCFNNQPWRYVFVHERVKLQEMFETLSKGNEWAKRASLIIAVFSKPENDCRIHGRNYYLFDTGMATAYLILKATDMGLVAHPIAGFDEKKVHEVLKIPDDMQVITLLVVGGHAEIIHPELSDKQVGWEKKRPDRLPINEFTFMNRYGHPE
jgi:nitroreductase